MRKIKQYICLLLILALCLTAAACGGGGGQTNAPDPEPTGLTTYQITLRTHSGQLLKGVGVRVFANADKTDLVWYDKTDAQGKMSFIADAFDGYVVTLENVPDGYTAADHYALTGLNTEIVLSIGLQTGVDLNTVKLNLGDPMVDMTITDAAGREHVLSKLLTSKKAVVLYFFDSGAVDTLAALEEARKSYADEVAVLAMNPVDSDVSGAVQEQLPVASCDPGWIGALNLTTFPAMVVVDRYGIISLLHQGPVGDAAVLRNVFAYFARTDYTPGTVKDIDSIVGKELQGTATNPYISDGSGDISVSVAPGRMVYYNIYNVEDMLLKIYSSNVQVMYGDTVYEPQNGVVTLELQAEDADTPVLVGIGNTGANTELFVARLSYQAGSQSNPTVVDLGQFLADLKEGNEKGLYYLHKAIKPGTLRFSATAQTPDVGWSYTITNRDTGVTLHSEKDMQADELTGETYMLLEVNANDEVILHVQTKPEKVTKPEPGTVYPAGKFLFRFDYEVTTGGDLQPLPDSGTKIDFSVTVSDNYGFGVPGVPVIFNDQNGSTTVTTNASGTATYSNTLGGVAVSIVPLRGYTVPKGEFQLNAGTNNVSVVFTGKMDMTPAAISAGQAYVAALGDNYAIMKSDVLTYFLFTPDRSGVYHFAAQASLGYWGTDSSNLVNLLHQTMATGQGFALTVTDADVGKTYIVSMTGVPYATLSIAWAEIPPEPSTEPTVPSEPTVPETTVPSEPVTEPTDDPPAVG